MPTKLIQVYSHPAACFKKIQDSSHLPRLRLLRLSVTDLCNYRCRYCMPAEGIPKAAHRELLSLESLAGLVRWLTINTEIDRVRLTGGEPLIRPEIGHLIIRLSSLPQIREVSLTTNGSLLSRMAWSLKSAGLSRVNISLDSLDQQRFADVTRGGNLQHVLEGIGAAQEAGLTPIKLNTVLRRSTWKQEVPSLLDFAAANGFEIRFIELMRTGTERAWCEMEYVSVEEVCDGLGTEILPAGEQTGAPARRTFVNWRGTPLAVGWITPRSRPFCARCERIRMDARGQVRRCLMDPATFDLTRVFKALDGPAAAREFQSYLAGKVAPIAMDTASTMSQIGG